MITLMSNWFFTCSIKVGHISLSKNTEQKDYEKYKEKYKKAKAHKGFCLSNTLKCNVSIILLWYINTFPITRKRALYRRARVTQKL